MYLFLSYSFKNFQQQSVIHLDFLQLKLFKQLLGLNYIVFNNYMNICWSVLP